MRAAALKRLSALLFLGLAAAAPRAADERPQAGLAAPRPGAIVSALPSDFAELHALAETLWDGFVPGVAEPGHELISRDELTVLFPRLTAAGQSEDLGRLAAQAPDTRAALASVRFQPELADYAKWLQNRLDDMEVADAALQETAPSLPLFVPPTRAPVVRQIDVPFYELWLGRVAERPRPSRADEFLPALREAFVAEGIPPELVWIAETESAFDPRARGTSGERGLFQLMPATARGLGLQPHERVQPKRSARAAASYLRYLHDRFGDWPLALAAYNAGESRVARELRRRDADNFASISRHLPVVTRFYVPKVLATIKVREGIDPGDLRAPTPPS